ncbi:protein kinase A [Rhizoctonia solani]|uniref:cAMP-dependent protein kinase n=1 Tax=Rhizoctonia solani TaxID=456999 RepID=A0A0K6GGX0_9AGAM|nr:protein kinase A [Rhizoctonia solani]
MSRMMSSVHAQWPKQPHRQHYPQQPQPQPQPQAYYPSAPSSAATPSLFAGTTRSSISSAYSHASPGVTHYPPPPEPDVSLDQLLESAYASDAPSPPTMDSGLLAGMDVGALVGDIDMSMIGSMDLDLGVAPPYDHAMDEFFGKMHDLGLDPSQAGHIPAIEPLPVPQQLHHVQPQVQQPRPQPQVRPQPQPQSQPQAQPAQQERTPMLSGRKDKRKLNNYTLKDFRILHTLGTGSFGRVHLACSRHNHRHYAVKVLNKAKVVQQKQVEHTNSERSVLATVRHPFIVNLWGTFQDVNNLFMVMDFVPGGELFTLLRKSRRFPSPVAKFYTAEVVLAIDYLHGHDIIYRDLKPENILLGADGHIKLTDFGFAKHVPDITWTLCGTPDYLAPEIVNQKSYNKSVDWYAVGILLYEMLAGAPPFFSEESNPMRLYERIRAGRIEYPRHFEPGAVNLMRGLLVTDLSLRLGNMIGGSKDVFNHPWFSEVPWERLANKEVQPPYVPQLGGDGDASQFERYNEEDTGQYGQTAGRDPHTALFTDFGPVTL